MRREGIRKSKRIVVKVGTSVLVSKDFALDKEWIRDFALQISLLLEQHRDVIVVSSGAIAAGMHLLGIKKRPHSLPEQQACASLGQGYLMNIYENSFKKGGFHSAQILLTWEDVRERRRYLNAENTIYTLLNKKAVPIINENDTVSVEEIKFGDNDKLSALVANLVGADILIILTDVEGLCAGERCISEVKDINGSLKGLAYDTDKEYSLGGMKTKLDACKIAMSSGVYCLIANGRKKEVLLNIMEGKDIGTIFIPTKTKLQARKRWIAFDAKVSGKVVVDDGARDAIVKKNKSLLACGIKALRGNFLYGDVITIVGSDGKEVAKGLCNYSSEDLEKIKGKNSKEIEKIINEGFYEEVVHRNNLVIL